MSQRKLALPCDCAGTCTVMLVSELGAWGNDPQEIYVDFYEHLTLSGSVRKRVRLAWQVLRGKEAVDHGLVFDEAEKLWRLVDFLVAILPSRSIYCETADCRNIADHFMTCEGDGAYPYCEECSLTLLASGETSHGPIGEKP